MRETQLTPQPTPASQPLWFGGNDESNNDKHYGVCAEGRGVCASKGGFVTKEVVKKTKMCTSVSKISAVMFLIITLRQLTAPSTKGIKRSAISACVRSKTITQCNMGRLQTCPVEHISYCKKPFPSKWNSYIRTNSMQ